MIVHLVATYLSLDTNFLSKSSNCFGGRNIFSVISRFNYLAMLYGVKIHVITIVVIIVVIAVHCNPT